MGVKGADGHRHREFRSLTDPGGNAQSLRPVFRRKFLGQLKHAELTADADIPFDVRDSYLLRSLREILQHLVGLDGDAAQIRAGGLSQQSCGLGID